MATQFDPIAKDESLNTTESPSRNVADVLAQGLDAIEQAIAGGSGSGGHTIVNASGTDMTQRAKMQFVDAVVTDDAVNDVTKISTTPASYPSANVTYGSGSVEDALDGLAIQNLWILYGHTAPNTASATWNTDSRVSRSVLLSVQVKLPDDGWYIMAQTSGFVSLAQVDSTGYPILYIQNATFYDKDCRAIYMTIS